MSADEHLQAREILHVRVDATCYADATRRVTRWARAGASRYVCICTVHMVMEAHDDASFCEVVNGADLVTPDGMPLVWALRAMGIPGASRVYGPDLMLELCACAERERIPVGLYGGTEAVLDDLRRNLLQKFPRLPLVYSHAPPFGDDSGLAEQVDSIRKAGARILFVALGCPKQERWMAKNRGSVPAVMLGVGAAFDFIAGHKPQAPAFLQAAGLEWAFRLASEPRRLWRRYAVHNPRFVALLTRQLIRIRAGR